MHYDAVFFFNVPLLLMTQFPFQEFNYLHTFKLCLAPGWTDLLSLDKEIQLQSKVLMTGLEKNISYIAVSVLCQFGQLSFFPE